MRAKNIGIFVPNYNAGGTEQVAIRLAKYLARWGYNINIISLSDHDFPYNCTYKQHKIDVNLPANVIARFFYRWRRLRVIIRKENLGIILSMGEYPNFLTAIAPKRDVLRINRYTNSSIATKGFRRYFMKVLSLVSFNFSNHSVVPALRLAAELGFGTSSKKLSVISNPIDVDELHILSRSGQRKGNLINDDYYIHVGQLVYQKNHDFLLKAFSKYLERGGRFRLKLVGKGPLQWDLKRLVSELNIKEKVDFLGWCGNPYGLIKNSKAVLLTSRWEGVPNVMIEGMALGKPIVSIDCPTGPREVLNGSLYGVLLSPDDEERFVEALLRLDNDSQFGDALSKLSTQRAKDYSIEKIGAEFVHLLQNS